MNDVNENVERALERLDNAQEKYRLARLEIEKSTRFSKILKLNMERTAKS